MSETWESGSVLHEMPDLVISCHLFQPLSLPTTECILITSRCIKKWITIPVPSHLHQSPRVKYHFILPPSPMTLIQKELLNVTSSSTNRSWQWVYQRQHSFSEHWFATNMPCARPPIEGPEPVEWISRKPLQTASPSFTRKGNWDAVRRRLSRPHDECRNSISVKHSLLHTT